MKTAIKSLVHTVLPEKSELYFKLWLTIKGKEKTNTIQWHLNNYSKQKKDVFFIQIGANDGFVSDPLYKFIRRDKWQGVLIEPVDYLFKQLKANYAPINTDNQLNFEQVAISNDTGSKEFYYVKSFTPSAEMPVYLNQQGSFNKEHLQKVKENFPKVEIGKMTIPCQTISNIIKKYKPKQVDLIHIDTEGHDYHIVKSIDFESTKPNMVFFEHRHITQAQRDELKEIFSKYNYNILEEEYDTFAWK